MATEESGRRTGVYRGWRYEIDETIVAWTQQIDAANESRLQAWAELTGELERRYAEAHAT